MALRHESAPTARGACSGQAGSRGQPRPVPLDVTALQRAAGNRAVVKAVEAGHPFQVQRLSGATGLTVEQQQKAAGYVDRALVDIAAGYSWTEAKAHLTGAEVVNLTRSWHDGLRALTNSGKKKADPRRLATLGQTVAQQLVALLATPQYVIAYAQGFDTKHVTAAFGPGSAVTLGNARQYKGKWSTVFEERYFVTALTEQARDKGVGDFEWRGSAQESKGSLALARFHAADQKYRAEAPAMFYFTVVYRVTKHPQRALYTVTASHLETDDN